MNETIIGELINELNISKKSIVATLELLMDGATIPFIARYRKEATGALDENQIKSISDKYQYYENLFKRKEDVIRLIDEKGLLTDELKSNIMACTKLTEVEDLYRPFKEKKKTKATEAIKMGLEPLAKKIMAFPVNGTLEDLAKGFPYDAKTCLENASYIIAEWFSDNAFYRKGLRNLIFNHGSIKSKVKDKSLDEKNTFEMYYDFSEKIKYAKSYRVLAMNRGEDLKILTVSLDYDKDEVLSYMVKHIIKNDKSFVVDYVTNAIKDSLKRLIMPSIEREIRSELTLNAEDSAIDVFKINLENLLMQRPIKGKRVLGFDPAFRTGCKLACLDEQGNLLHKDVVYPTAPHLDYENSKKKILELISKYNLNLVCIGNGTASRESEEFIASVIKDLDGVYYTIVSEAGASVYSASAEAQREFPDLQVQERSAISIGRRVQDPLSELVKIDPKSIGIGEYQHDVDQKKLADNLSFTVSKVVNEVGVNVNTASNFILKYISGLSTQMINKLQKYKETHVIKSREELKSKVLTPKAYEQAIGFLRVPDSVNEFDKTGIHPESYDVASNLLKELNLKLDDINTEEFKKALKSADVKSLASKLNTDTYTLEDIIKELSNPLLDPREEVDPPILRSDVLKIEDLSKGMKLKGTVRNVASFGAFIDIGLHDDGLLHISKMSKEFIKHPTDVLSVGEVIEVYVDDIDIKKNKVSLTLFS